MSKYINILKCYTEIGSSLATLRWFKLGCALYRLKLLRAGMTEHFVELQNGRVHYWSGGRGDFLVMIHGYGAEAVLEWHGQAGTMAKQHTLIAPDMMWFGESDSDKEDYTIDFQAQVIRQLLEALGINRFHLMGHSHGGIVSAMLATMLPDQVQKVVIVDSPAVPTPMTEEEKERIRRERGIESAVDLLVPKTVADMRRLLALGYHNPPRVPSFVLKGALPYFRRNLKQRIGMATILRTTSTTTLTTLSTISGKKRWSSGGCTTSCQWRLGSESRRA